MPLQSTLAFSSQNQSQNPTTPSSSHPHRIRQPPSNPGMIPPSPDGRRRLSIPTECTPSNTKRPAPIEVLDKSDSEEGEVERVEPAKKKQKKKPANKQKTTKSKETAGTGTGSTFVDKETLRADSDIENDKVQPRAPKMSKQENNDLNDYYDVPFRRKTDVSSLFFITTCLYISNH
ncbi:uncharacterized protein MELLADRAFT_111033 [Melampsora larici-populina 98AG31]|uniref:Uncharacterized protein n=1 Tax=Melampsora larici-populina (strain 98AG31 / pathotype 3-4-7) TaxID=747676 RepID=F4S1T8_MELLP|nr:uncharacterized protein MELLADRAFT_111033 [Melampsora larici-populina 98AG31]EGG01432.1 hypothetical protein MELLADRAFT_111033 [Melampsora larici-populina 98AG31]